ncbi:hypothetical protein ONE63_005064 [Megalurothrips usitatus]|uniref:Uncharacterized protein n=1 Tax=Megalurothrips usitatus TaxID=439358 RepID=A0AAV7X571_9NEOP|nr:hypothetical protein ONE63_005064 [Megalurothrips usitatus]
MLEFGCHHHTLELTVGAAFYDLFQNSKDPNLPFFEKLEKEWDTINKGNYRTAASARKLRCIPEADELIKFCREQLKERQPRGDYEESLQLILVFLGSVVPGKVVYTFKKPGCRSKCRWMAIIIYSMKSWMFGKKLKLKPEEDSNLFKLCVFLCRAYVRTWFLAPLSPQAPRNDLAYLQVLYRNKDEGSHWEAALEKFMNHLWYLSATSVPMALFDNGVAVDEKRRMVAALRRGTDRSPPSPRAEVQLDDTVLDLKLSDFCSKQSLRFFSATAISTDFLKKDPEHWKSDSDGLNIVTHFKIVNDCAERGVALINRNLKGNTLTVDEEQRQLLLLVVANDRKQHQLRS